MDGVEARWERSIDKGAFAIEWSALAIERGRGDLGGHRGRVAVAAEQDRVSRNNPS